MGYDERLPLKNRDLNNSNKTTDRFQLPDLGLSTMAEEEEAEGGRKKAIGQQFMENRQCTCILWSAPRLVLRTKGGKAKREGWWGKRTRDF